MGATRLLVVSNLYHPVVVGGAEIVAQRQAEAMKARGYDVAVFAGGFPGPDFAAGSLALEEVGGIPVYRLALVSLSPGDNFHWPAARLRFTSLLAAHRPDIVHFHNLIGLGADLVPIARGAGARTVVTLHDHWGFCFKNTLLRNDLRLCTDVDECAACLPTIAGAGAPETPIRLRRDYVAHCIDQADVLVSPSRYLARAMTASGAVRRPVGHVSNGINLANVPVSGKPTTGRVDFGSFGYLGVHKGFATLLDAAETLAADEALAGRWTLTIAGHGELGEQLEADIASGRFGGAVRYAGRLDHVAALALMRRLHVIVLASIWPENQPVTLLEAIASGTAQLASRIGGNPELIEDGKSGFLFTPGDADDLATKMRRFIDEPDFAHRCGARNAERRADFSEETAIDRFEELYRGAPATPPPADKIVVLCAGRGASPGVQMMIHEFRHIEDRGRRVRFVRHEWADADLWGAASLLWFWTDGGAADLPLLGRALRGGIPVLAPDGSISRPAASSALPIASYSTLLAALGHIAARQDVSPATATLAASAGSLGRLLTAVAPRDSFDLSVSVTL